MKQSLGFYLLLVVTWPMQLFPLEFHYPVSGFLYLIIYRLVGYRKQVVRENLKNSFPGKSEQEIKNIEVEFYRGFCDMFVETLYFAHFSGKKKSKRLQVENLDLLVKLTKQGRNVICVAGHQGNWEFMQLFTDKEHIKAKRYFLFKKINSRAFDDFYRHLRGRIAAPLEMKEAPRQLLSDAKKGENFVAYFISDQRPMPHEIKYWVNFLNQDTPVLLGTEKMAIRTNAAVVYLEVSKIKRGYHKVSFELLFEQAAETEKYEITNRFMERLEASVRACPSQYFWTHKRWKFKKEAFEN